MGHIIPTRWFYKTSHFYKQFVNNILVRLLVTVLRDSFLLPLATQIQLGRESR
jgi:hypothetical protein